MSDESAKDVSPLRLKRPVQPAPPPTGEGLPPETIPPAVIPPEPPPVLFLPPEPPQMIPPHATIPPTDPAAVIPSLRRRPTLAAEGAGAPESAPAPASVPAESPTIPPTPAAEVIMPVKLRMGAKPPPPAPPPGIGADLPDDLFPPIPQGAPLMPLPGLSSLAPLPGAPPQGAPPPPVSRPLGTALIGGIDPPVSDAANAYKMATGGNAPLMPMSVAATATRPPMPAATGPVDPKRFRASRDTPSTARRVLTMLLLLVVLGGLGAGAYFYFMRPDDSAKALADMKTKFEKAAQLPAKAMENAVENAKESLAGARGAEQARVDNVVDGKETPDKRGIGGVSPAELEAKLKAENAKIDKPAPPPTPKAAPPPPAVATEAYAGGATGADAVAKTPPASARFMKYAETLSVSGVFQGAPARALVDGRIIRTGDLIEPSLGVSFVGVDAATKHLILQDTTGAQVRVKY